jgi:hypothetical protein
VDDVLARIVNDLLGRLSGPLTLRVVLQPLMATCFAARDGIADARHGRPPYLWTITKSREERRRLIVDGAKAIGKLVVMAIGLDLVYQVLVFRRIYPFEAIDVAIILAVLPYFILRGPFSRMARLWSAS